MNGIRERRVGNLKIVEVPGDPNSATIILLHGFGANAFDLLSMSTLYPGLHWIFPQAPFEVSHQGYAWFDIDIITLSIAMREQRFDEIAKAFPPQIDGARVAIDALLDHLDFPREKIFLGGFSQGAILATETLLHSSSKMGALLLFSGTVINEDNWRRYAPSHTETPFFQSHGLYDPLLPVKKAEELSKLLRDSGLKGKLEIFPGGHEIPQSTLKKFSEFLKNKINS